MQDSKVTEALEGKVSLDELNDEQKEQYRDALKEKAEETRKEADEAKSELTGFRAAKRAESEKVEKLRKEAEEWESKLSKAKDEIEKNNETLENSRKEITQFRQEQIQKAEEKFFKEHPDLDKDDIKDKFARLDSGKVDPDLIYKDFLSAYAASDPEGYIKSKSKMEEMEKNAQARINEEAGSKGGSEPTGKEEGQVSEEAKKLAKDADISEEAAEKQLKQGMRRTY